MKKIRFKKITAFLLVMCMTLSMLPVKLFAEQEVTESEVTQSEDLADEVISPIIVSEDVTKRGENEKHFLCDDGSYIAVSYPTAVHEQVDGEWVDIEYNVNEDGEGISPIDDSIKVKFANNTNSSKLVKLEADEYKISWTVEAESLEGDITEKVKLFKDSKTVLKTAKELAKENSDKIKKSAKYTAEEVAGAKQKAKAELKKLDLQKSENIEESQEVLAVNGIIEDYNRQQIQSVTTAQSSIEYEGAFGEGTVLRYILSPGKINEEIVLDSYNGFKSYSMVIDTDGLTPAAKENGRVDLADEDGNTVVTIAPPFMYDSLDNVSHDVEVTVTQENKKQWRITYTPDQNWLKDENRAYPVVIDPTVTTRLQYQADTYVYQGQGLYDYHYAETFLWVGYQVLENNQKKEFISYWGYNMDLPTNGVVTANNITDVSFYIRAKEDTERLGRISLYDTDEFYGNINTVTWNNRPEVGSRNYGHVTSMMSDNWLCFSNDNLYETIKEYYDNASIHEILFALKTTATSSLSSPTALYSSNSSYIPYIAIEYVGGETTEPDTGVDGGSGTEPGLIYPAGYTTEIETGVYIIKNQYNSRYLHHSDGNNTVNVWNFGNQPYQRWYVEKNGLDGTYTFSSSSTENPGLNMEVYFGENENDQPITMYNYSGQAESRAYRFFIIKNTNGTYSIMPTVSTDKVLEVYAGQNYSDTFGEYDRLFYKNNGESVQLKSFTGTANQCWTFKNTTQYDREWDNTLAEGTYIIKNSQTGNALSHIISTNTAEATPYTGESYQRWKLIKTDVTGIYTLSPDSQPLFNLELYYASLNGACDDGHTFTLNNYSNNTSSPYIKVRVKKHTVGQEVKYSIFPLVTPDKCIEVYLGEDTTYTFNTRTFTKSNGRFLQNTTYIASEVQKWEFVPLMGITPESCELHIGDTYDLDNVTPINTQNDLTWNLTFGEDFVNFDSTTNEVFAKRPGIAVFETRLPDGIDYQFTVKVLESRLLEDGVYYIKNNYSNKYISPAGNSISNGTYLKQEEKIEGDYAQMWEITYANNGGYTIKPAYDTLLGVTTTNNSSGNNYSVSMVNNSEAKWAIVECSTGSYNIIPLDYPEKALSIEPVTPENGIDVVVQNRLNGANQQEWSFENVSINKAVILIHGRASNSKDCWGAENSVSDGINDEYEANENIDYTAVATQAVISHTINNDNDEGGNLAYYLTRDEELEKTYTENINLFVFNYPNQGAVRNNASLFKEYIINLQKHVSDSNSAIMKQAFSMYDDHFSFNIVGHSMGGLVARYYIENMDGDIKVEKLITIDTPHWGSNYANISNEYGIKHCLCDHDLDTESAMFGGSESITNGCNICQTDYVFTNELNYSDVRETKYYAIAGVNCLILEINQNDYECEIETPGDCTNLTELASFLKNKHEKLDFDVQKADDNIVGFLSQIGWKNSEDGNIPGGIVEMEKIFIDIDTDGGNFIVLLGLLHSKIQHREKVMEKVEEYLRIE